MTFKEWMETVPAFIRNDAVWRVEAYRLALFAGDLAWQDVSRLIRDKRTISLADQLNRSAGAVSGNICEGYSRRSGKDQARFYEYGLGSAREARDLVLQGAACSRGVCMQSSNGASHADHQGPISDDSD
jgi:23S rRNA-intervening sequence protein